MLDDNILVTGFGPFGRHKVNASWEAVKLLPNSINSFNLIKQEIPVTYNDVDNLVPLLWKKYNPKLVVHVGVSSCSNKIDIESCAYRKGYKNEDCQGNTHLTGECEKASNEDCLFTVLNVQELCDAINKEGKLKAVVSKNAGRYLCEYIYYKSLSRDNQRTVFVHVPRLGMPYSAEELAEGLILIIQNALAQLTFEENEIVQDII